MKKPKQQNSPPTAQSGGEKSAGSPIRPGSDGTVSKAAVPEIGVEPVAKQASVPVLLIALLVGLIYWGDMFIIEHGGQLDARVHYPYTSFKQLEDLQPKDETAILKAQGARVYKQICSGCHQDDGNGNAAQNYPPLAGSEWVLARDPARIIRIVLHGLSGPITVRGKEYGQGVMLAWGPQLSDEDIALALTYARNSWGNKAPIVTADQVKKVREDTKAWSGYMTVEELSKVALKE